MKNNIKKGYSLIELILVMSLSALAMLSLLQWQTTQAQIAAAQNAGGQLAEVGKALSGYLGREQTVIAASVPNGTTVTCPITLLGAGVPAACGALPPLNYLPTTFNATNAFGATYAIQINNNNGLLTAIAVTNSAICEYPNATLACPSANNPIRYDWIGEAMQSIGPQSGMTTAATPTTLSGYNAGWTLSNAQFPALATAGLLGVRVSTTDTALYDAQYLRLDGTSVMLGSLNMGNFNISNVTNITYNGWLTGFGVLANTVNSGTINNTGTIQTANLTATTNIMAGTKTVPSSVAANIGVGLIQTDGSIQANKTITAMTNMTTKDIYLGNTDASILAPPASGGRTLPGAWLSDLLPKYVSRGIYNVNNGNTLAKPTCGAGGIPRIELIPAVTYTQGRVLGTITISGGVVTQDEYSYNPQAIWANDLGASWQVMFATSSYGAPSFVMNGLAHIYCDYGF